MAKTRLTCELTTAVIQLSCAVCSEKVKQGAEFLSVGPTMSHDDEGYVVCLDCTGKIPPFSLTAATLRERRLVAGA